MCLWSSLVRENWKFQSWNRKQREGGTQEAPGGLPAFLGPAMVWGMARSGWNPDYVASPTALPRRQKCDSEWPEWNKAGSDGSCWLIKLRTMVFARSLLIQYFLLCLCFISAESFCAHGRYTIRVQPGYSWSGVLCNALIQREWVSLCLTISSLTRRWPCRKLFLNRLLSILKKIIGY